MERQADLFHQLLFHDFDAHQFASALQRTMAQRHHLLLIDDDSRILSFYPPVLQLEHCVHRMDQETEIYTILQKQLKYIFKVLTDFNSLVI